MTPASVAVYSPATMPPTMMPGAIRAGRAYSMVRPRWRQTTRSALG